MLRIDIWKGLKLFGNGFWVLYIELNNEIC